MELDAGDDRRLDGADVLAASSVWQRAIQAE